MVEICERALRGDAAAVQACIDIMEDTAARRAECDDDEDDDADGW